MIQWILVKLKLVRVRTCLGCNSVYWHRKWRKDTVRSVQFCTDRCSRSYFRGYRLGRDLREDVRFRYVLKGFNDGKR